VEIKRGDVFLVDLNPVVGAEQAGIRPALVIQIDKANAASPHTVIIPFTTRIRQVKLPSHVRIPAGIAGLAEESILLCEQIRVIDKTRLVRKIGSVGEEHLRQIGVAIKVILGLD
jgi:mRNA interferase MazF